MNIKRLKMPEKMKMKMKMKMEMKAMTSRKVKVAKSFKGIKKIKVAAAKMKLRRSFKKSAKNNATYNNAKVDDIGMGMGIGTGTVGVNTNTKTSANTSAKSANEAAKGMGSIRNSIGSSGKWIKKILIRPKFPRPPRMHTKKTGNNNNNSNAKNIIIIHNNTSVASNEEFNRSSCVDVDKDIIDPSLKPPPPPPSPSNNDADDLDQLDSPSPPPHEIITSNNNINININVNVVSPTFKHEVEELEEMDAHHHTNLSEEVDTVDVTSIGSAAPPPPDQASKDDEEEELEEDQAQAQEITEELQHQPHNQIDNSELLLNVMVGTQPHMGLEDITNFTQDKAIILIQSAFRAHLARRAYRALKSLVRLQAVVRGVCVRRQARIALHCMNTLARLQVRVRARQLLA